MPDERLSFPGGRFWPSASVFPLGRYSHRSKYDPSFQDPMSKRIYCIVVPRPYDVLFGVSAAIGPSTNPHLSSGEDTLTLPGVVVGRIRIAREVVNPDTDPDLVKYSGMVSSNSVSATAFSYAWMSKLRRACNSGDILLLDDPSLPIAGGFPVLGVFSYPRAEWMDYMLDSHFPGDKREEIAGLFRLCTALSSTVFSSAAELRHALTVVSQFPSSVASQSPTIGSILAPFDGISEPNATLMCPWCWDTGFVADTAADCNRYCLCHVGVRLESVSGLFSATPSGGRTCVNVLAEAIGIKLDSPTTSLGALRRRWHSGGPVSKPLFTDATEIFVYVKVYGRDHTRNHIVLTGLKGGHSFRTCPVLQKFELNMDEFFGHITLDAAFASDELCEEVSLYDNSDVECGVCHDTGLLPHSVSGLFESARRAPAETFCLCSAGVYSSNCSRVQENGVSILKSFGNCKRCLDTGFLPPRTARALGFVSGTVRISTESGRNGYCICGAGGYYRGFFDAMAVRVDGSFRGPSVARLAERLGFPGSSGRSRLSDLRPEVSRYPEVFKNVLLRVDVFGPKDFRNHVCLARDVESHTFIAGETVDTVMFVDGTFHGFVTLPVAVAPGDLADTVGLFSSSFPEVSAML